ncbi:hypothetical protein LTSESEN_3835, partial [Salmonella enterica subsp. enterica serovar Senftenberg str. A4-543]
MHRYRDLFSPRYWQKKQRAAPAIEYDANSS